MSEIILPSERLALERTDMIDAHRIASKLWIGSYPEDPRVKQKFDVIVLCANEHQTLPFDHNVMRVPLDDSKPTQKEVALALRAATAVNILRKQDKRVLVTCHAGVNRSSLVAAIALVKSGMSPWRAIELIREKRQPPIGLKPLCNPHFTELLMRMTASG